MLLRERSSSSSSAAKRPPLDPPLGRIAPVASGSETPKANPAKDAEAGAPGVFRTPNETDV